MYDGLNILINDENFVKRLRDNDLLSFLKKSEYPAKNGRMVDLVYFTYKGLTFKITDNNQVSINGSIHKYWNDGVQNFNDFYYSDYKNAITTLCNEFGNEFLTGKIQNLEYGFNLISPFSPSKFSENTILYFANGIHFKSPITDDNKGFDRGIQFILAEYKLKIYDKGNQYHETDNILRVEVKTISMREFRKFGIHTIADTFKIDVITSLTGDLLKKFDNLLIGDNSIELTGLKPKHQIVYLECKDPYEWKKFTYDKVKTRKSKFNEIISMLGTNRYKPVTRQLIAEKANQLLKNTLIPGTAQTEKTTLLKSPKNPKYSNPLPKIKLGDCGTPIPSINTNTSNSTLTPHTTNTLINPHTKPKTYSVSTNRSNDKKWYIYFNFPIPNQLKQKYKPRKTKRFKVYDNINRCKREERVEYTKNRVLFWKYELEIMQYNPFQDELNSLNIDQDK
jgi:hypothetical protein